MRTITLLTMLLACLSAAADNFVWNYKHTKKHCPVAGNGATTFFFDTAGYPLVWP